MSLVPMKLQTGFNVHKSRVPEAAMRGRMFEAAMTRLVDWWCETFTVRPYGHVKSRTYEEVQERVVERLARKADRKGKRRARDDDDEDSQLCGCAAIDFIVEPVGARSSLALPRPAPSRALDATDED